MIRPIMLVGPGVMLVLGVMGVPIGLMLALSARDIGANYGPLLTRDGAGLFATTLKLAGVVASLSTVVALLVALGARGRVRLWVLGLTLAPKFAGSLAVLLGFRTLLSLLAPTLQSSFPAAVLAESLLIVPYLVLILVAQLDQQGGELAIVARTLGASRWQAFRFITWPQLAPAVSLAWLLAVTWGLGAALGITLFGSPRETTLGVEVYRQAFDYARPTRAAAAVTVMTFITAIPLMLWLRLTRRS